jgi:polyisoprenyl-teichoic acid--peptidoglycan teichoic acid transferase
MKMSKKTIVLISLCVCLGAIVICVWGVWSFAQRRPNTSLANLSKQLATQSPTSETAQSQPTSPIENLTLLPTPEQYIPPNSLPALSIPTPAGNKTLCGGPPLMFIQVAGVDEFNLADAIRIVRVDFTTGTVSVLAIERATWVTIPHLEEHGITTMLVNAAHSYGVHWMGKAGGVYLLSETIALNFGIKSDHFLDISFNSFVKAVDAVGGVDVNLPKGAYDAETGINLSPGPHHLDGKTALLYVRFRYPDSDWKRIDRQSDFMINLFKKLTAPEMLPKLPGLVNQMQGDFFTDLSPLEMGQLVCLATRISTDKIKFYEIGQDMVTPTTLKDTAKSQVMIPKYDLIRPYVEKFIEGTLP